MVDALLALGLLLVCAKILEGVATRLRQSSLLAYVLVGIVLGPALDFIEPTEELDLFFKLGVFFLFFLIGIDEIDISGFVASLRGRFLAAAAIAFTLPFGITLVVFLYILDLSSAAAVAVAALMGLSSLGVVAKVLGDLGHLREPFGLEVFTLVLMVEVVGLLVSGFAIQQATDAGGFNGWNIPILLGEMVGFVVVAWVLAGRVIPPVIVRLRRYLGAPQLSFGLMVGGLFLVVEGAEQLGIEGALAALLFGIVNSGLPRRLRNEILPSVRGMANGVFIPLFFASAGLRLNLSFLDLTWTTVLYILIAVVLGKLAGSLLTVYATRLDRPLAFASGLMGKGVVEIALLLVMLEAAVLSEQLFSLLTIIMIGFIFVVPPLLGQAISHSKPSEHPVLPGSIVPSFARYSLEGVTIKDVLKKEPKLPKQDITVQEFMEMWVVPEQQEYVIVEDDPKRLAGIISLRRIRRIPKDRWEETKLADLVQTSHQVAYPDDPLDDVLERMSDHATSVVPVIEIGTGELLGSVTNRDVLEMMIEEEPHKA